MKRIKVSPNKLIPTDYPRSLVGILKFVPLLFSKKKIDPIAIVPRSRPVPGKTGEFFVCSGNHRAAAAYICKCKIDAIVLESPDDLDHVCEGRASKCKSILDLEVQCSDEAEGGQYLSGRWEEYLRMITDSASVGYEESHGLNSSELGLLRKSW